MMARYYSVGTMSHFARLIRMSKCGLNHPTNPHHGKGICGGHGGSPGTIYIPIEMQCTNKIQILWGKNVYLKKRWGGLNNYEKM